MAHYFDAQPASPHEALTFDFDYGGKHFVFHSSSGVFSRRHLDEGSRVLLDGVEKYLAGPGEALAAGDAGAAPTLLDLGCGYGVIGIVLKRLHPQWTLVLADINERALDLARQNVRENRVGYTEILRSDAWEGLSGRAFDLVVSNPPIRAGKATVYRFFAGAREQVRVGGAFICVLSKRQGADSAKRELQRLFGHCEVLERGKGFHVLLSRRR